MEHCNNRRSAIFNERKQNRSKMVEVSGGLIKHCTVKPGDPGVTAETKVWLRLGRKNT